jgi:hypothetical protein
VAAQSEQGVLLALEMLSEWSLTISSMLEYLERVESELVVEMS